VNQPLPAARMTVDAFETWLCEAAPPGRYELSAGRVVAMAPERMGHNRAKTAAFDALRAASRDLPCEAVADGMAVRIDETTQREPDAALRCGPPLPADATRCDDPVVLVEITSPATAQTDFAAKLVDYARVQTLAHYLIIDTERGVAIHHRRTSDDYVTLILPGGTLALDSPGLTLDLDPILEAAD
jgi:Uma2 family endonuclease